MKTTQKLFALLPLFLILIGFTSFTNPGKDKGETIYWYHTLEDYYKGNVTSTWEKYKERHTGILQAARFDAIIDGKEVENGKMSDYENWGYKDKQNKLFRYLNFKTCGKMGIGPYRVACTGKVWLYMSDCWEYKGLNDSIRVIKVCTTDALCQYLSIGGNGEVGDMMDKNLQTVFADDPDILAEMKQEHGVSANFMESKRKKEVAKVIKWVNEYNSRHKE